MNEYESDPRNYEYYLTDSESKAEKKPITSAIPVQHSTN